MNSLKEAFRMQNLLKNLNFFGELNLGLILTAVGIVYFKNPNHFAFGGTSGLSILLADLFPKINVGGFMWIINLVLVDRKSTRLNSSHPTTSRMPSSA